MNDISDFFLTCSFSSSSLETSHHPRPAFPSCPIVKGLISKEKDFSELITDWQGGNLTVEGEAGTL